MSMFRSTRLMVLGAKLLFLTLTSRVGELFFDLAVRLRRGRGLNSGRRLFLLRDFRLDLEVAVEDAERHAVPDEEAGRVTMIRSLIRWLEFGDSPGPAAIPFLEGQLGRIGRDPDVAELARRSDRGPSEVVAYLYGSEEPKLEEIFDLALASE